MKPEDKVIKSFSNADLNELIRATLVKGASFRVKALGLSMSPFIKNEDILTISPFDYSDAFGKVVAFEIPKRNKLIVHRIVKVNKESFTIKGDNILTIDGIISRDGILGVVTKVEREGKRIFLGLGADRVLIAFLSRKGLFPFIFFLWRIIPYHIRKFIKCVIHL